MEEPLRQLQEELESDNKEGVADLLNPVLDSLSDKRNRDETIDNVAQEIHTYSSSDEKASDAAASYFETVTEAGQNRMKMNQIILEYLIGETTADEALEVVNKTVQTEQSLAAEIDTVEEAKMDVSLPPVIAITDISDIEIHKGNPISETFSIENHGQTIIEKGEVQVKSDIPLKLKESSISNLEPNDSIEKRTECPPQDPGQYEILIEVRVGRKRTTKQLNAIVASQVDYLKRAQEQVEDVLGFVNSLLNPSDDEFLNDHPGRGKNRRKGSGRNPGKGDAKGRSKNRNQNNGQGEPGRRRKKNRFVKNKHGRNGLNGIKNKLETADKRIVQVIETIAGSDEDIASQISAIINLLETVTSQAEELSGKHVDSGGASLLRLNTNQTIQTLKGAKDAIQ